jgi:hypothetical protein
MYALLYPAVLGTVLLDIFGLLSTIVEGESIAGPNFGIGKLVLTTGIVVHFIVDFLLAQEAPEHGWTGFVFDCSVLAGLWVAAASIHLGSFAMPDLWMLCVALAWVYVMFLCYLTLIYRKLRYATLVAAVEIFSLLWFVVGAVWFTNLTYAATGLFVSAILLLWVGSKALKEAVVERAGIETPVT